MEALQALLSRWPAAIHAAIARRRSRERGQGYVEYALILMLMALVVIVMLSVVGHVTNNVFSNISTGIGQ
ncbi:MAG TPA: Flp family type IVb pilin [Candidatus Dormibacteraeota bacterium]